MTWDGDVVVAQAPASLPLRTGSIVRGPARSSSHPWSARTVGASWPAPGQGQHLDDRRAVRDGAATARVPAPSVDRLVPRPSAATVRPSPRLRSARLPSSADGRTGRRSGAWERAPRPGSSERRRPRRGDPARPGRRPGGRRTPGLADDDGERVGALDGLLDLSGDGRTALVARAGRGLEIVDVESGAATASLPDSRKLAAGALEDYRPGGALRGHSGRRVLTAGENVRLGMPRRRWRSSHFSVGRTSPGPRVRRRRSPGARRVPTLGRRSSELRTGNWSRPTEAPPTRSHRTERSSPTPRTRAASLSSISARAPASRCRTATAARSTASRTALHN